MKILGISALYHDSAAALIEDGVIIAAAQEERFTRIKHDKRLPVNAIKFVLTVGQYKFNEIDIITYYDNPMLTVHRFCQNVCTLKDKANDLIDRSFDDLLGDKVWIRHNLIAEFGAMKTSAIFLITKHHLSHAASAFFPSPYQEALILTNDGVGEWQTTTIGYGENNKLHVLKDIKYPHSLGLFYSAFTFFCGFKVNEGDYKFMGLAPYGEPIYYDLIKRNVIDIKEDGSYRLNLEYFDYQNGKTMVSSKMAELFGGERRVPEARISRREMNIAASVQKITEEIIIKQAKYAKQLRPEVDNLVLAGGCALNCVANGKLLKENLFNNIWIQPAAGDAGGAIGSALYAYFCYLGKERIINLNDSQGSTYLGISYENDVIKKYLDSINAQYVFADDSLLPRIIAEYLEAGKVIGHFYGRAEFGPRALGNRSILADPRSKETQTLLNLKIKYRESFRPFAPSVLYERCSDYFELDTESPYMLLCADVNRERRYSFCLKEQLEFSDADMIPIVNQQRSDIPAVTHVDYSARVQTVTRERNERYYNIIKEFEKLTGCGVVVNTSFNVRGEPIVNSPKDAYICFMRTEMDVLVIENYILLKENQPKLEEEGDWREKYELD